VHDSRAVTVAVGVKQVCVLQQILVGYNLRGSSIAGDAAILQHYTAVGDVLDDVQLVGASNRGFNAAAVDEKIDHPALALGVKGSGGHIVQ
jgi:hypothetical protein